MIQIEEKRLFAAASTASSISALCALVGDSLGGAPETSVAAEAIEGLGEMAQALSNTLHNAADTEPMRAVPALGENRHAAWLAERRATLARAETLTEGTPVHDAACITVNELDRKIMKTAAANAGEMLAKLTLLVIVNAEGASSTSEDAARIAAEAEPFLAGRA
jgi:hypothetical protein